MLTVTNALAWEITKSRCTGSNLMEKLVAEKFSENRDLILNCVTFPLLKDSVFKIVAEHSCSKKRDYRLGLEIPSTTRNLLTDTNALHM